MINFKKLFLITTTAAVISTSALAKPETYTFEDNHTSITWTANHFGFSNPSGKFMDIQGSITLDEENPDQSSVIAIIKPASIVTGIEKFDNHLKSPDFFNVENYPVATFKSSNVTLIDKNHAKVTGTLTLLDINKPVTLNVTLNKIAPNPMNQISTAGFSATTTIKRSEFGINYAIPGVSDEVALLIEVEAQKK